jgi:hypothetical protein
VIEAEALKLDAAASGARFRETTAAAAPSPKRPRAHQHARGRLSTIERRACTPRTQTAEDVSARPDATRRTRGCAALAQRAARTALPDEVEVDRVLSHGPSASAT